MTFYTGVGIILERQGEYLLIQEVRNEKSGFYNLPAGTLESNETLLECVMHETKEETGIDISPEYFVGVYQTVLATGNNILFFVYAASIPEGSTFHSDEHKVIKLFSYKEILDYDKAGKLRAPTVLKSIEDYRNNQKLSLSVVQTWHLDTLPTITVDKDH